MALYRNDGEGIFTDVSGEAGLAVDLFGMGVAAGLVASLALTSFLESMLFQVEAADVPTFSTVAATLIVVGVLASLIPAIRAASRSSTCSTCWRSSRPSCAGTSSSR